MSSNSLTLRDNIQIYEKGSSIFEILNFFVLSILFSNSWPILKKVAWLFSTFRVPPNFSMLLPDLREV